MKLIELFSGIGGFAKGFQDAGYSFPMHQFSEIDKHAISNYRYNFKDAEYIGSVTDVRGERSDERTIIALGSPCQDFSLAGKRAGMEGTRSSLIAEAIRIVSETKPDVFIWENVKGAFSSNNGADFWAIIAAFANIGGYRLEWQLLNTAWFLPQNRERIYLIGHLDGRSRPGVFPFTSSHFINNQSNEDKEKLYENSLTLTAKGITNNTGRFVKQIKPSKESGNKQPYQQNRIYNANGISTTIDQSAGRCSIITKGHGFYQSNEVSICPTLKSSSFEHNNHVKNNDTIRRLTEIECERLQGFPDDWTKYGVYDNEVKAIAKTQRYKMCGNAVTTNVVKAIAERLVFLD